MNIVIIGGSRGIGKAAARELLQDGNNVLIVGRNPKTLEETGKELAGAATYSCDAGKAEETTGLVDAVKNGKIAGFGDNVDGLILCAAVFPNPATKTSVVQPEPEELQAMLDSNVTAYYRLVKEFLPLLAPAASYSSVPLRESAETGAASTAFPNGRSGPMPMPSGRNASLWGSVYPSSIPAAPLPRPERNPPKRTGHF